MNHVLLIIVSGRCCFLLPYIISICFHGTDEEDTRYAKLLLASQEEVLKQVIFLLLLAFICLIRIRSVLDVV